MDPQTAPESFKALEFAGSIVGQVLLASFSAFAGAWAAFLLENRRQKREEANKKHGALMTAQVCLITQCNSIHFLIYPGGEVSDKNPYDNLKTMVPPPPSPFVDLKEVSFIGEGSDPQLILDIHVAGQAYQTFISAIEVRNLAIKEFMDHERTITKEFDKETGQAKYGGDPRLIHKIKQSSEIIFATGKKALPVFQETLRRLGKMMIAEYPDKKALSAGFKKNESLPKV